MPCPHCGADAMRRDYAPPRPFAYLLGGGALLFAMMFWPSPKLAQGGTRAAIMEFVAYAALLVGSVELARHGNIYCGVCGMKFRRARRTTAAGFDRNAVVERSVDETKKSLASAADDPAAPFARYHADGGHRHEPPADTPIPPLLKVLRFKNPAMRADAAATLQQLTGQSFGEDADAWDRWWAEHSHNRTKE